MAKNKKVTLLDIHNQIHLLEAKIEEHYVSKKEFWPVKTLVYGFVAIVLTAVIGALVARVVIAN